MGKCLRQGAASLVLRVLALAGCVSAPTPPANPGKLYGTWSNKEYFGANWSHMLVFGTDGSTWLRITEHWRYGTYNEEVARSNTLYRLVKISPAGDTLESESSARTWPPEFGALGSHHLVFFRQL